MATFPVRLRELRKEKGMTQNELSEALRFTKSRIPMYETGRREPDFETLEIFADYFNVDMAYLIGESNIKIQNPINRETAKEIPARLQVYADKLERLDEEDIAEVMAFLDMKLSKAKYNE